MKRAWAAARAALPWAVVSVAAHGLTDMVGWAHLSPLHHLFRSPPQTAPYEALYARVLPVLRKAEGYRRYAYDDATAQRVRAPRGNLTVGYGTDLDAGLTKREADWLAKHRLREELDALRRDRPSLDWQTLPAPAKDALAMMAYQLGAGGVGEFHAMLAAVGRGDWETAAREAEKSRWAHETPARAKRVAELLREAGR